MRQIIVCHVFILLISFPVLSATIAGKNLLNNGKNGFDCQQGNGKKGHGRRVLTEVRNINVSGAFDVSVVCSNMTPQVLLEADENILKYIQTEVQGDHLSIYHNAPVCLDGQIKVTLIVPEVYSVSSDGSNDITVKCDSGYKALILKLAGASDMKIIGSGHFLQAKLADATDLTVNKGIFDIAEVTASGSSTAIISVKNQLNAISKDASEIYYTNLVGILNASVSGVGDVLSLEE